MIRDLVIKNRTYRRFFENEKIDRKTLEELVDLARLSPSGGNMQSLKYIISFEKKDNDKIFPNLVWASYLKDWDGPCEGERPSAYIVVLSDTKINKNFFWDHGIASQSILLGAAEKGLGGCQFGVFKEKPLRKELDIPEQYKVIMVIALGKPKETVVLEDIKDSSDIKYWRDENKVHHVPKRKLNDLIIN